MRAQWCSLTEERLWIIKWQRAVDFISRNLQISVVSVGALAIIPERLCNTQKSDSTHNVSVSKGTWIFNRTVYVTLCCKVNNVIRMIGLKQLCQSLFIPNIYMSKGIARILIIFREVLKVACIRQSIHVQDMNVLISSKHIVDKVRSNKSSSTSY